MAETFGGIINREVKDSTPWWPEPNLPDKDLPNIVTVLLDLSLIHISEPTRPY